MKLPTKLLKTALIDLGRVIKTRTTLPILECVHIEAMNGFATLRVSSFETGMTRILACDDVLPPTCVKHHDLLRMIEGAPAEETVIETERGRLIVTCGSAVLKLPVQGVEEFPREPDSGKPVAVNALDLADGIDATAWWIVENRDDFRDSIRVKLAPKELTCVAAGGQLALFQRPLICGEHDFIVRAEYAESLASELRKDHAELSASDSHLFARHPAGNFLCRLGEGPYVNHLPAVEMMGTVEVPLPDLSPLIRACEVAIATAPLNSVAVIAINCTGDTMVIEANRGVYIDTLPWSSPVVPRFAFSAKKILTMLRTIAPTKLVPGESCTGWRNGDALFLHSHLREPQVEAKAA